MTKLDIRDILLSIINEMSFTKKDYERKLQGSLSGVFGEYMCRKIAKDIGKEDNWTPEIIRLSTKVKNIILESKTKFKLKDKNINEIMCEASDLSEIIYAKNKIESYYKTSWKSIKKLHYNIDTEFKTMLEEFLPEFANIFKRKIN